MRINIKSWCDVAISHGNSRTITPDELIIFADDNSNLTAFSTQPDLITTTGKYYHGQRG